MGSDHRHGFRSGGIRSRNILNRFAALASISPSAQSCRFSRRNHRSSSRSLLVIPSHRHPSSTSGLAQPVTNRQSVRLQIPGQFLRPPARPHRFCQVSPNLRQVRWSCPRHRVLSSPLPRGSGVHETGSTSPELLPAPFSCCRCPATSLLGSLPVPAHRPDVRTLSTRAGTTRNSSGETELLTYNQKVGPRTPGVSDDRPLSTAFPMTPPETSWDTALLKRHSNASWAMPCNSRPVSHLREHTASTSPYPMLSGNDTTTKAPPADS
jgi:hypothetical protein